MKMYTVMCASLDKCCGKWEHGFKDDRVDFFSTRKKAEDFISSMSYDYVFCELHPRLFYGKIPHIDKDKINNKGERTITFNGLYSSKANERYRFYVKVETIH